MNSEIIFGDSLTLIEKIRDNSIDCIFTDPPYGLKRKDIENDESLKLFHSIVPDFYRVLKDDKFFITFFSTKFLPEIFINNPFTYFWQVILHSPNSAVNSPIGFTKYMSVLVFKKGNPKIIKRNTDIFNDSPGRKVEIDEGYIDHPTPKPKHFISEILDMFTRENDTILDPFSGSGSILLTCKLLKRKYIGFEINKDYFELSKKRLERKWLFE